MKKLILIAMMASGLVACAQSTAPQEDSRLRRKRNNISSLPTRKVYAYWIISSVCVQRKPEMIRR